MLSAAAHIHDPVHLILGQVGIAQPFELVGQLFLGKQEVDRKHDGEKQPQNALVQATDNTGGESHAVQSKLEDLLQLGIELILRGRYQRGGQIFTQVEIAVEQPLIQFCIGYRQLFDNAFDGFAHLSDQIGYHQTEDQDQNGKNDQHGQRSFQFGADFETIQETKYLVFKEIHRNVQEQSQQTTDQKGCQNAEGLQKQPAKPVQMLGNGKNDDQDRTNNKDVPHFLAFHTVPPSGRICKTPRISYHILSVLLTCFMEFLQKNRTGWLSGPKAVRSVGTGA